MRMFSDCTGKCKECVAHFIGDCLAGHGDDDFQQITVDIAKALLNNPALAHRKDMILNKFPELKTYQIKE